MPGNININGCILLASLLALIVGFFTWVIGYMAGLSGADAPVTAVELARFQLGAHKACLLCYADTINTTRASLRKFRQLSFGGQAKYVHGLGTDFGSPCVHCVGSSSGSVPTQLIDGGGIR